MEGPLRGARLALAVALVAVTAGGATAADSAHPPTVLLLFSLRSTAPAVSEIEASFRGEVEKAYGAPVDLQVEHLDLPDASVAVYTRRLADLLREKYAGRRVDVVVVQEGQALRLLLENRDALFPGVPVVFTDVTRRSIAGLRLPPEVTGAFLVLEGQRTVSVAVDLHPEARRVVLVAGSSPADRAFEAVGKGLVEARSPGMETVSLAGLPLDEQLRRLAELPADSVVIFVSYRADSLGRSMVSRDVLRLVTRASSAPVYGAVEPWLGLGIVGGDLIDYRTLGARAALLTSRILRGESPAALSPIEQPVSSLKFDWRQLQRWGIDEARLPQGSVVLFREKTLWSEHWGAILGAVALLIVQTLLIAALLVERRSRIRAQASTREAERRYRMVADFTYDWEYWRRPDGSLAYVSPSCLRTTGYEAAEFERRPSLLDELVVEEDRPRWKEHDEEAQAGGGSSRLEFRVRTAGGGVRWVDHVCSRVTGEDGTFLGVRGSNRDVTEKKRSEEALRAALAEIQRLRERLEADNTYLREQVEPEMGAEGIVGRSDVVRYVLSRVHQVAPTSSTVLLQGETGVGKELVAHALHNLSPRRARPLVKLNCAALSPSLVESELFGHEKGAFTGAVAQRKGRFEIADGSTLFLDEVGDLPLELQAKLLRVIQDGELERVGGNTTLKTDVRLVAATHRRLDEEVRAGRFREDLWYRLNVFPITMPPLRQRREDVPLLVQHFVEKHCRKLGRPALQVSQGTLQGLQAYDWPGNVRELEAVVERAVITSTGPALRIGDERGPGAPAAPAAADRPAPPGVVAGPTAAGGPAPAGSARTLADLERDHIVATLERTYWRLEGEDGAAALLGMNPSTLRSRMRKHGIRRPASRPPEEPPRAQ
jgi:formate hydrogenlyase transcriptional activator